MVADGPPRLGAHVGRDQAQREREVPAAQRDPDVRGGVVAGRDVGDGAPEQVDGLVGGEHVHGDADRARHGQAAAAGDQHQAVRPVGQQRPDLVGVRGVVQHHERAQPGQPLPVEGGAPVEVVGDPLARHAEQPEEPVEHGGRVGGRLGQVGVEAAQVDEQHLVPRAVAGQDVTRVDREAGLADPGHALDHGDPGRAAVAVRQCREAVQLGGAAGELGQVVGQRVLGADLGRGLGLGADHAQRLPPLRDVALVGVQGAHHLDDEVGVEPPAARPEAVDDRGLARQLPRRSARGRPRRVDPVADGLVRGVAAPDLEQPQPGDQVVQGPRLPRIRQRGTPVESISERRHVPHSTPDPIPRRRRVRNRSGSPDRVRPSRMIGTGPAARPSVVARPGVGRNPGRSPRPGQWWRPPVNDLGALDGCHPEPSRPRPRLGSGRLLPRQRGGKRGSGFPSAVGGCCGREARGARAPDPLSRTAARALHRTAYSRHPSFGMSAYTLAGEPEPPRLTVPPTSTQAPVGGSSSRFASTSRLIRCSR